MFAGKVCNNFLNFIFVNVYKSNIVLNAWTGVDKFLSRRPTFGCANNEWSKPKCTFDRDTTKVYVQSRYNPSVRSIEKQPKCTFDQDTTENIGFCSLLPKKDLQLSF